jgi:hypothetical protein
MLNKDFKEFIQSLSANCVQFLVVGGYAVAVHGHPRYTKGMDIWIGRSLENAEWLVAALHQFGFGSLGLTDADFLEPDQVVQLGYPPNRIDIVTSLSGVEFDGCYERRLVVLLDDEPVSFIGLDDLRLNKRATGTPQDLADFGNLE